MGGGTLGESTSSTTASTSTRQFDGAGDDIARLERELIGKSDLVITCSSLLQESKSRLNPNCVLVRHGVEQDHFKKALDAETELPADIRDLPKPVLGFYGLVAEWVDLEAMAKVAEAYPQGSVVIVGEHNNANPEGMARLRALPNVHFLGRKTYSELPAYCKAFDVALLPFIKNELTANANPLKLREYLAAGLPVVSTDIPEAMASLNMASTSLKAPTRLSPASARRSRRALDRIVRDRTRWHARAGTRRWLISKPC